VPSASKSTSFDHHVPFILLNRKNFSDSFADEKFVTSDSFMPEAFTLVAFVLEVFAITQHVWPQGSAQYQLPLEQGL